jgi:hypothetical protein
MVTPTLNFVWNRAVGHITVVELELQYCTPEDGYSRYSKHVEIL